MTIMQTAVATSHTDGPKIIASSILPNYTSNASRTLSLTNVHLPGDMLIAMTANRTTTAPALLADYTNILDINNSAGSNSRSVRVQYKYATSSSESITWTGAYGFIIALRNASKVLQSQQLNGTATVTVVPIPSISGMNTSCKSLVLASCYFMNLTTATTAPFNIYSNSFVYFEKNPYDSLTGKTMTLSSSAGDVSFIIEVI